MISLRTRLIPALLLSGCISTAQTRSPATQYLPSAESVMNRVATNQDTAEAERAHYIRLQ